MFAEPAVVGGCYTTPPPSRLSGPALRRRGQMVLPGSGAGGREPAAGYAAFGEGGNFGIPSIM